MNLKENIAVYMRLIKKKKQKGKWYLKMYRTFSTTVNMDTFPFKILLFENFFTVSNLQYFNPLVGGYCNSSI